MNQFENPWLQIPISDYVGHMSDKHVRQYEMLNAIFKRAYSIRKPSQLLVLGVSDGNGLEHISNKITAKTVALDINPEYIAAAQRRFQKELPQCDFICEDIEKYKFPPGSFDMIHAALIFEYVNYQKIMIKIAQSLVIGGVLSTAIQLEDAHVSTISETNYKSLKKLASIIKMIDINEFQTCAVANNLLEIHREIIKPYGEKGFYFGILERVK